MRTVVAFPVKPVAAVRGFLEREGEVYDLAGLEWRLSEYLLVRIVSEAGGLYDEWMWKDVEVLTRRVGHRPDWALVIDVSGRIPGHDEVRRLLREVLDEGGWAVDDYSADAWTLAEADDQVSHPFGRRFFDPGPW